MAREIGWELRQCLRCSTQYIARKMSDGTWVNSVCPNQVRRRRRKNLAGICGSDKYRVLKTNMVVLEKVEGAEAQP